MILNQLIKLDNITENSSFVYNNIESIEVSNNSEMAIVFIRYKIDGINNYFQLLPGQTFNLYKDVGKYEYVSVRSYPIISPVPEVVIYDDEIDLTTGGVYQGKTTKKLSYVVNGYALEMNYLVKTYDNLGVLLTENLETYVDLQSSGVIKVIQ